MRLPLSMMLVAACGACAYGAEEVRPKPDDIKEFMADPVHRGPASEYFKDFMVKQKDFDAILNDYHRVEEKHWKHGYSHVAFGDRTGHVILKDGRTIEWMVRPGGLAWLKFPSGKKLFLAREKTQVEPDVGADSQ